MALLESLQTEKQLVIRQRRELIELFGFETRNKYEICNSEGHVIGFCAEQQKGILGTLLRQFLGHWRSFEIHFFDPDRKLRFRALHPFRFFFQRLEISSVEGRRLGALQQRFAILRKKFDVLDEHGRVVMRMRSGFFQFWTFPFFRQNSQVAVVRKKWSGILREAFTDTDHFQIEFEKPDLTEVEKILILASGLFVDLQYFERKAAHD
jgi:hypothetical protein